MGSWLGVAVLTHSQLRRRPPSYSLRKLWTLPNPLRLPQIRHPGQRPQSATHLPPTPVMAAAAAEQGGRGRGGVQVSDRESTRGEPGPFR